MSSKPPVPPSSRDPNRSIAESNAEGILQHAVDQLVIERDELRAKLKRWEAIDLGKIDAINELRAEVERLRAEVVRLDDLADDRLMEVERLRAKVDRLGPKH